MKTLRLAKTIGLTTALVLGAGLSARAAVTMTFSWAGTYYEAGYTATYINSSDAIGIYKFNTSAEDGVPNPMWSVCLSPAGLLDSNSHTYNVLDFSTASPGIYPNTWAVVSGQPVGINNAAYLWNKYGMDIVNNTGNVGYQGQRAAALEFAIWTALYDSTGYGQLGPPNNWNWVAPSMDQTTQGYYDTDINGLISSGITGPQFTGNILEGQGAVSGGPNSGQSQEFFLLGTPAAHITGTPVPEPTTLVAGALLLLPFGFSTLRILRKSRTA